MTSPRHRVVAALDLAEYSEIVLEHTIAQVAQHEACDLHVLHVVPAATDELDEVKRSLGELVLPALESLTHVDSRLHCHVRSGDTPEEITNLAAEIRAHMIVIGRFGTHHPHRRIGLTASRVIDLAPCPTLVVGLTDQTTDAQPQCAACVALRAESDGTRWFCPAHTAPDRLRLSTVIMRGTGWPAGLMW